MNELDAAVYSTLTGDATLVALLSSPTAVYADAAPEGAVFPLVVFHDTPARDIYTLAERAFERHRFTVKACVKGGDQTTAGVIAARIDELLTDHAFPVTGRTLLNCRRETPLKFTQIDAGVLYRYAGGVYVLEVA